MEQFDNAAFQMRKVNWFGKKILGLQCRGALGDVAGKGAIKITGISLVAGWRRKISQTDRPSKSGSRMSSRIKSGLNCRARLNASTPLVATMNSHPSPARRYCINSTNSLLVIHNQNPWYHAGLNKVTASTPIQRRYG